MGNIPQNKAFRLKTGIAISSLAGMAQEFERMSRETFTYHANGQRNDFATWINDVFRAPDLASRIHKDKTQKEMAESIRDYLSGKKPHHKIKHLIHKARRRVKSPLKAIQKAETVDPAPHAQAFLRAYMAMQRPNTSKMYMMRGFHDFLVGLIMGILIGMLLSYLLP